MLVSAGCGWFVVVCGGVVFAVLQLFLTLVL